MLPLDVLQELTGKEDKVSQIYLKMDDPANTDAVVRDAQSRSSPTTPFYSMPKSCSPCTTRTTSRRCGSSRSSIMAIGVIIGFAVVCLSMYMAVLQRTREIGILKSLGVVEGFILRIILVEAALLGVGGTILGILMSSAPAGC